jgi:nucleoside-diphosphate-sugar epimerase
MINPRDHNLRYAGVRAVVLGTSGFIGRWVARALSARYAKVYAIVRDAEAMGKISAEYEITAEVLEQDLSDFEEIKRLFEEIRPSIVFNLAGYGIDRAERDPQTMSRINADLVKGLSEAVAAYRDQAWERQNIIHVGTALEYGEIAGSLQEDSVPAPTTDYGRSKLAATLILASCCRALGLKGLTARLFAVYGPGELEGRLLPSLMRSASTLKPLELTAGEQMRDFTYVEDVAEGLLRLGLVPLEAFPAVNLATGRLTSVREFAETSAAVLGMPKEMLKFGALPTRPEEMNHSPVSIERLKQLTGWSPETRIKAGIRKAVAFEKSRGSDVQFRDTSALLSWRAES